MHSLLDDLRSSLSRQLVPSASYRGSAGPVWFAGFEPRALAIAGFFAGDSVISRARGRVWRPTIPFKTSKVADAGGISVVRLHEPDAGASSFLNRGVAVPELVDIHTALPDNCDSLRDDLLTSTTREDFRRIRRAGFEYRVTREADAIREFHSRHYIPLVKQQFPEDGRIKSVDRMLGMLEHGGELVCADLDGEWVAGMFNIPHAKTYALMTLGIREADPAIRKKRVVAALIIRSLERGVELDRERASLGRSLPFLGKGPVWFKAKWNGTLSRDPSAQDMHMFMDLRHEAVRRMLAASPIIHRESRDLVVSTWLEPGERPLKTVVREAGRYPGIQRWYVLGERSTLDAAAEQLVAVGTIRPVAVNPQGARRSWLGSILRESSG